MGAAVKIMLSYDYCHFEIMKSTDQPVTDAEINELRKDVQRLADKAVAQYKISREALDKIASIDREKSNLEWHYNKIKTIPESERTPEMDAIIKKFENVEYWKNRRERYSYNYEEEYLDWEEEEEEDQNLF